MPVRGSVTPPKTPPTLKKRKEKKLESFFAQAKGKHLLLRLLHLALAHISRQRKGGPLGSRAGI